MQKQTRQVNANELGEGFGMAESGETKVCLSARKVAKVERAVATSYRKNRYVLLNVYSLILGMACLALAFMLVFEG